MISDPQRHRFKDGLDENDVRLRTERQYLPYEHEFKRPSKEIYNGAGYNLWYMEGYAELVGDKPEFWTMKS